MRKLSFISSLATAAVLSLGVAYAGSTTTASSPAKASKAAGHRSTTTSAPGKAKHAAVPGAHNVSGHLAAIDADTVTIKTGKGSMTLHLDGESKLWLGTRSVAIGDLSASTGAKLRATYVKVNGEDVVRSLHVQTASTHPAAAPRKKK